LAVIVSQVHKKFNQFRNQFANVGEYWALYPDAPLCRDVTPLPRVESGARLAAIQAQVNPPAALPPLFPC